MDLKFIEKRLFFVACLVGCWLGTGVFTILVFAPAFIVAQDTGKLLLLAALIPAPFMVSWMLVGYGANKRVMSHSEEFAIAVSAFLAMVHFAPGLLAAWLGWITLKIFVLWITIPLSFLLLVTFFQDILANKKGTVTSKVGEQAEVGRF
jgi:hypothetical protein